MGISNGIRENSGTCGPRGKTMPREAVTIHPVLLTDTPPALPGKMAGAFLHAPTF